jgi:hypothetical protein
VPTSRNQLLNNPTSGAHPLPGSPGAGPRHIPARRKTGGAPPAKQPTGFWQAPPASPGGAPAVAPPPTPAAPGTPVVAPAAASPAAATAARGTSAGVIEQGSGVLAALVIYPLVMNLVKGGPAQMWGWVKAKWLNQPYAAPAKGYTSPFGAGAVLPTPTGAAPAPGTTGNPIGEQ